MPKPSHHGRSIAAVARSLALLGLIVLLGACTPIGAVKTVVGVVAKPILGLAVKDAETTLAWVDREVEAGRLAPVDVDLAKRCPEAVIALDALRARMSEGPAGVDGFKGMIFYGTKSRFGQGVQVEAGRYLEEIAKACLPLVPAEKLMGVF